MLRGEAKFFGWVFVIIGVLGFVPRVTYGGHLFGIFAVNAALNVAHLVTGAALLWAWNRSECASMRMFRVVGVIYALAGLAALVSVGAPFLGAFAINRVDTLAHLIFAAIALFLGFYEPARHPVNCSA